MGQTRCGTLVMEPAGDDPGIAGGLEPFVGSTISGVPRQIGDRLQKWGDRGLSLASGVRTSLWETTGCPLGRSRELCSGAFQGDRERQAAEQDRERLLQSDADTKFVPTREVRMTRHTACGVSERGAPISGRRQLARSESQCHPIPESHQRELASARIWEGAYDETITAVVVCQPQGARAVKNRS